LILFYFFDKSFHVKGVNTLTYGGQV
jgi:hypothetical protein